MKPLDKMDNQEKKIRSYLEQPYARVLIPEPEGGFSAEILEFPGCFSQGETPNEAIASLEEVAEAWLEAALEQGQEIPSPSASHSYSGRFALRMPRDIHRMAAAKAARDGVSLNACLVTAIAAWVGADNLYERITHKVTTNFVQMTNYIQHNIQVTSLWGSGSGETPWTMPWNAMSVTLEPLSIYVGDLNTALAQLGNTEEIDHDRRR